MRKSLSVPEHELQIIFSTIQVESNLYRGLGAVRVDETGWQFCPLFVVFLFLLLLHVLNFPLKSYNVFKRFGATVVDRSYKLKLALDNPQGTEIKIYTKLRSSRYIFYTNCTTLYPSNPTTTRLRTYPTYPPLR